MTKFVQNLVDRLKALAKGMVTNSGQWTGQPVTTTDLNNAVKALEDKDNEIDDAKDAVHQRQTEARDLVTDYDKLAEQVEDLARGIHKTVPAKLSDYDIKLRKESTPKPVPGTAIIASLADDSDGIGFVITIQPLENADDFEIERAITTADVKTTTDFKHLKTTKKLTYVDDDVEPGMRYHYRVRGFNRNGSGPIGASVSKIQ